MVEKGSQPDESERSDAASSEGGRTVADLPEQRIGLGELQDRVPPEIRSVSFPISFRGYGRRAVDAYVERVNRVIAELEVSRSPRSAVRHALDRVTDQVRGILDQARESAEQITVSAREEAEQTTARAKAEAANIVVDASAQADRTRAESEELLANAQREAEALVGRSKAEAEDMLAKARGEAAEHRRRSEDELSALQTQAEAQLQQLQNDDQAVRGRRQLVLEEIRALATQLEELAREAAARFPATEPMEPEHEDTPALHPKVQTPESEVERAVAIEETAVAAAPRQNEQSGEDAAKGRKRGGRHTKPAAGA